MSASNRSRPKVSIRDVREFLGGATIFGVGVLLGAVSRPTVAPTDQTPRVFAWAHCDIARAAADDQGCMIGQSNIISASLLGDGIVRFRFETPMPSDQYAVVTCGEFAHVRVVTHDSAGFDVQITNGLDQTAVDGHVFVMVFAGP